VAVAKTPAKILRILGNSDTVLERTHVGIYDYIDQLTSLAFTTSVSVNTATVAPAAYTTIATVGFPFTQRRIANFKGVFLIQDNPLTLSTDIDIGLFSTTIKGLTPSSPGGTTSFLRADGTWAAPAGGGITQLTGDVTAGPGSGSVVATLANIPTATPAAGTIVFAKVASPSAPAAAHRVVWADSTTGQLTTKDTLGSLSVATNPLTAVASQFVTGLSVFGALQTAQPAFTDISGTLGSAQFGPLTGDVTTSGYVATLANIPSGTPAAGSILFTQIAVPGTPAAGKGSVYVDSTSKNLCIKKDNGFVSHCVNTKAATASLWINSIDDAGAVGTSQPAFTDITGTLGPGQFGPLTGDVTTAAYVATIAGHAVTNAKFRQGGALSVVGVAGNSTGDVADISASAGGGAALRESGSTIGFGTLSTAAYGANSVTYAKIQTETGSTLLGRGNGGSGNVQELSPTGVVEMLASSVNYPRELSLTFGGQMISVGTQLLFAPFYLGVGDNAWSTANNFGLIVPIASRKQNITYFVFQENLSGTGSPTYAITLMNNATPILTLATLGCGGGPAANFVNTTQVWSTFTVTGIKISTASGVINGGTIGLYVVMRCEE
jgi:hypothetical protein